MDTNVYFRSWWEEVTTSLWFRPAWITLLAVALAFGSTALDARVDPPDFLNTGPDNARAMLSAIASSTLTVTSLTFSIIMMALVMGSQQFSPRTLRNFMRDAASQNVLGIFIGTFMFSLLVLARVTSTDASTFVPTYSVMLALFLALLSVAALIYFIHHIAQALQVNHLIAEINELTESVLEESLPDRFGQSLAEVGHDEPPVLQDDEAYVVQAQGVGYLQTVDPEALIDISRRFDIIVSLETRVGDFVPRHSVLFRVWPEIRGNDEVAKQLRDTVHLGVVRTMFEDVLYGFRQLVDIALKALSPGVNDPTTATNCVDYLTNLLIQMTTREDPIPWRYDEDGSLRAFIPGTSFKDALDLAFSEIRLYSASDFGTTLHLLTSLAVIARAAPNAERRAQVWQHAHMIVRGVDGELTEPYDRERINRALCAVADAVGESCEEVKLALTGPSVLG